VRFSNELKQVDAMRNHPDEKEIVPIENLENVWLGRL